MTEDEIGQFVAGFVSGVGSFFVTARPAYARHKAVLHVVCGFSVKVQAEDRELLELLRDALGVSAALHDLPRGQAMLMVRKASDLTEGVIPFFDRYPLRGRQRDSYAVWREVVHLVERGAHLTPAGAAEIEALKARGPRR